MGDTRLSGGDLLALTPGVYLREGYRDAHGEARPELTGLWAVAAAQQLKQAGVTPPMLDGGVRALSAVALVQATGPLAEPQTLALRAAIADQPRAVKDFLGATIAAAQGQADLRPMLAHLAQVLSLLALKTAIAG